MGRLLRRLLALPSAAAVVSTRMCSMGGNQAHSCWLALACLCHHPVRPVLAVGSVACCWLTGCAAVVPLPCLPQVDQIYHLACPASPVHYK